MTACPSATWHVRAARNLRRSISKACTTLATIACVATAGVAQVNGGFEANNFSGWTVEYSNYTGAGTFTPWVGVRPIAHPVETVINSSTALSPCQPSRVLPYEDTYMAQINDLAGGYHATRIWQTFSPTAFDLATSGMLSGQVGALLVDPGHPADAQPGFRAELLVNGSTYGAVQVNATQAAANGWQVLGNCGSDPVYYKRFKYCVDLKHLKVSDVITVRLTVWDCAYGGHGAMAFCDGVKWDVCTAPPSDMVGWWYETMWNAPVRDLAGAPYNDGVNTGPLTPLHCAKIGNALSHYTVNYVAVPDHNDLDFPVNQDFSIDLWANPTIQSGRLDPLVSKMCYSSSGFDDGYFFYLDNGNPTLLLTSGFAWTVHKDTTVSVPLNEWSHLAVTVDRASVTPVVKFYFNGDLLTGVYPAPLTGSLTNGDELRLGGPPCGNSFTDLFSGCTDEIELFRRVLTGDEVMRVAANCKGKCKPCLIRPTLATGGRGVTSATAVGNLFDVTVTAPEPISVCAVSVRPYGFSGPFDVSVYATPTTYVGKTNTAGAWTLVGTGSGVSAGGTTTTSQIVECAMTTPFNLLQGNYGLAVFLHNPSGTSSLAYSAHPATSGSMPPWSDPDVTIVPSPATAPGVASSGLFGLSSPGLWNGAIHYRKASTEAQPGFCFFGAGCPSSAGPICRQILLSPALLGSTASAAITNTPPMGLGIQALGLSGTMASFGPLPLDLAPLGAPGCQLRVSADLTQFLVGSASGSMTWSFPVPNAPALAGLPLYSQAVVFDASANSLGAVVSDANELILGR